MGTWLEVGPRCKNTIWRSRLSEERDCQGVDKRPSPPSSEIFPLSELLELRYICIWGTKGTRALGCLD